MDTDRAGIAALTPPPADRRIGGSERPAQARPRPPAPGASLDRTRADLAALRLEGLVTGQVSAIHRIRLSGWLMTRPPAARLVMTQADETAHVLGHASTDARHILLCTLSGDARIPGRILASLDLTLDQVRLHLMDRLMGTAPEATTDAATAGIRELAIGLGQLDAILRLAAKGLLSVGAMRMEVGDLVVAGMVSRGQVRSLLDGPDDPPITQRLPILAAS
jgi:hypothetical protein